MNKHDRKILKRIARALEAQANIMIASYEASAKETQDEEDEKRAFAEEYNFALWEEQI